LPSSSSSSSSSFYSEDNDGSSVVRESYFNPAGLPCRLEIIASGVRVSLLNRRAATEEAERLKRLVKEFQIAESKER
jgi:hypothetical protein